MHTPMRTCIVCRQVKCKKDLFRIVKNKNGEILSDTKQTIDGRGVYVCKNNACIADLAKKRALNRAFKQEVSHDIYEKIIEQLR